VSDDLQEINASLNQVAEVHDVTVGGPPAGNGPPLVMLGRKAEHREVGLKEEL
jgi:hypothetical protein